MLASSGLDCLGSEVVSTYHELEPRIKICKANSEVRFGDIVIDSMITDVSGRQVGVEVFVTNAKSNEDKKKFAQLDFEVFEIDLSNVSRIRLTFMVFWFLFQLASIINTTTQGWGETFSI